MAAIVGFSARRYLSVTRPSRRHRVLIARKRVKPCSHSDLRGWKTDSPGAVKSAPPLCRFVHSGITTAASYAICFLKSVASTAGRTELSLAVAVKSTDRSLGQRKTQSN
jgi:hypothetical protein